MKRHVPVVLAGLLASGFVAAEGMNFNQAVRAALVSSPVLESHYREWGVSGPGLALGGVGKDGGTELPPDTFGGVLAVQAKDLAGLDGGRRSSAESFAKALAAVKSAYIRAVAARQLADVRRDALKAADAAFSLIDGQRKAGSAASSEWLKARQALAQARFELTEAEAEMAAEKQRFISQAGLKDADLADALPDLPGPLPELTTLQTERLAVDAELINSAIVRDREARGRAAFRSIPQQLPLNLPTRVTVPETRLTGEAALEYRLQLAEHQAETVELLGRAKALETLVWAYQQHLLPAAQERSDETLKAYNGMLVSVYSLIETKREELTLLEGFIKARRDLWLAWLELEAGGTQIARSS